MNLDTLKDVRAALTVGAAVRVRNHLIPERSRVATILRSNTASFWTSNNGAEPTRVEWPPAAAIRPGPHPNSVVFLGTKPPGRVVEYDPDGEPFLTITILEEGLNV